MGNSTLSITFKDFFSKSVQKENRHLHLTMPSDYLVEMAVPLDVSKFPVKIDEDDIEFLQQFPSEYWVKALHKRYYDDLMDAIEARYKKRLPSYEQLRGQLQQAFQTGDFSSLQGKVSDDLLNKLQSGSYSHVIGNEKLAEKAADKLAELEVERQIPHSDDPKDEGLPPGYKVYEFPKSRRGGGKVQIVAKPNLNRLIHKLERNRGEEHLPGSGLEGKKGMYGYDLFHPQRGTEFAPHTTRGAQLPNIEAVRERLSDFLGQNLHRMYGDLPEDEETPWMPVGRGRDIFRDRWAYKRIYDKLTADIIRGIKTSEPGTYKMPDGSPISPQQFRTHNQIEKAARQIAMAQILDMAERGELRGAPIPGVEPEGPVIKTKESNKRGKKLDLPIIHLPHKRTTILVKDGDKVVRRPAMVPIVKPAEYLRALGTEEGDEEIDQSMLRGLNKDWVAIPHEQWKQRKDYLASGALHLTRNTPGRMHLDESDPEFQEREQEIFGDMKTVSLNKDNRPIKNSDGGKYYDDIIAGIWYCLDSESCGGATAHEKNILKDEIHDLHQYIWMQMRLNLRDPKLNTSRGRRAFAKNITSLWAQQDLGQGGGTRRLRVLSQKDRNISMDAGGENEEGKQISWRDQIEQRMKSRESQDDTSRLGQGGRLLPTGRGSPGAEAQWQFTYSIHRLRELVRELEAEAQQADNERQSVDADALSQDVADLLGDAIRDRVALLIKLKLVLKNLYSGIAKLPDNEAEFMADKKLDAYGAQEHKQAAQIVAAFKNDPEVQALVARIGQATPAEGGDEPISMADRDALDRFNQMVARIPADMLKTDQAKQALANFVQELGSPKPVVQAFNRIYSQQAAAQPTQTRAAARTVQQNQPSVQDLIAQKDYLGLAQHPEYLRAARPEKLQGLLGWLQRNKQSIDPDEFEVAMARLSHVLKLRGVK